MFSSKCCNTSTVSEPIKIVKIVNIFECFANDYSVGTPWKRHTTIQIHIFFDDTYGGEKHELNIMFLALVFLSDEIHELLHQ